MLTNGNVFYKYMKAPGDPGFLPVFIIRCIKHGYYMDYPHGYDGVFYCPHCEKERTKIRCLA
jgi:hypothetical protein